MYFYRYRLKSIVLQPDAYFLSSLCLPNQHFNACVMAEAARNAAKKKRSTAKQRFHRAYNIMTDGLREDEEEEVLNQIMSDLENSYKEIEEKNEHLIETIDPSDEENNVALILKLEDEMNIMYSELCDTRKGIIGIRRSQRDRNKSSVTGEREVRSRDSQLKIKPLQAPTFTGNIREYPCFKRDFESHMTRVYGKDPFVLKTCLSGEALQHVIAVDDDYDEMMKRLDMKYGRPEKLIDVILGELKSLRRVEENDNKRFVQMVDLIERMGVKKGKIQGRRASL